VIACLPWLPSRLIPTLLLFALPLCVCSGLHVLYEAETATAGAAAKFEVHHGVTAADLAKTLKEDFAIPAATLHAIPHLAAHA